MGAWIDEWVNEYRSCYIVLDRYQKIDPSASFLENEYERNGMYDTIHERNEYSTAGGR